MSSNPQTPNEDQLPKARGVQGELVNATCTCGHSWVKHQDNAHADWFCDAEGCDCGAYAQVEEPTPPNEVDELESCYVALWEAIDDAATARRIERKFKEAIHRESAKEVDKRERCPECHGGTWVPGGLDPAFCNTCNGSGSIPYEDHSGVGNGIEDLIGVLQVYGADEVDRQNIERWTRGTLKAELARESAKEREAGIVTYTGERIILCDNCPQFLRGNGWEISQCNSCQNKRMAAIKPEVEEG